MPGGAACYWSQTDKYDFPKHDKRRHLRARGNKGGASYGRALVGVGRPQMERRGGNLKAKADKCCRDSDGKQRRNGPGGYLLADHSQTRAPRDSVNEAYSKKCECACRAP